MIKNEEISINFFDLKLTPTSVVRPGYFRLDDFRTCNWTFHWGRPGYARIEVDYEALPEEIIKDLFDFKLSVTIDREWVDEEGETKTEEFHGLVSRIETRSNSGVTAVFDPSCVANVSVGVGGAPGTEMKRDVAIEYTPDSISKYGTREVVNFYNNYGIPVPDPANYDRFLYGTGPDRIHKSGMQATFKRRVAQVKADGSYLKDSGGNFVFAERDVPATPHAGWPVADLTRPTAQYLYAYNGAPIKIGGSRRSRTGNVIIIDLFEVSKVFNFFAVDPLRGAQIVVGHVNHIEAWLAAYWGYYVQRITRPQAQYDVHLYKAKDRSFAEAVNDLTVMKDHSGIGLNNIYTWTRADYGVRIELRRDSWLDLDHERKSAHWTSVSDVLWDQLHEGKKGLVIERRDNEFWIKIINNRNRTKETRITDELPAYEWDIRVGDKIDYAMLLGGDKYLIGPVQNLCVTREVTATAGRPTFVDLELGYEAITMGSLFSMEQKNRSLFASGQGQ